MTHATYNAYMTCIICITTQVGQHSTNSNIKDIIKDSFLKQKGQCPIIKCEKITRPIMVRFSQHKGKFNDFKSFLKETKSSSTVLYIM